MTLTLTSSGFQNGGRIPKRYTCEGDDLSPPLEWSDPPAGAMSFALIVDDPDAPNPAKPLRVYVHWILYDIPPNATGLVENASRGNLPPGTVTGINDAKKRAWGGPCPPIGRHRYFFKLYALDTLLKQIGSATKQGLEAAMQGHILAQAELMGTYQKGD